MNQFHVGRGETRGALTVFPIWAESVGPVSYALDRTKTRVRERPDGASVGSLLVTNTAAVPLLLLEGQLLEGGMQHRMVAHSTLLPPETEVPLDVVCVEQGRWHGAGAHSVRGRLASTRVRAGLRTNDPQSEVWRRVAAYDGRFGQNATSSYLTHAERAESTVRELVRGLRPFPGQVGVLIGLGGQPLSAEIFDSPRILARQFPEIVRAAAIDSVGRPPITTPGRRSRRFLDRAANVRSQEIRPAGLAEAVAGRSEYVEMSALRWSGQDLYTLLINARHDLVLAS